MSDVHTDTGKGSKKKFTAEEAKKAMPKLALPAGPKFLERGDSAFKDYLAKIPTGHTLSAVVSDPLYWAHHAKKFALSGRIDAVAEDGSFDVTLRIMSKGDNWAKVRVLRLWLPEIDVSAKLADEGGTPLEERITVESQGGSKFRVIDKGTNQVLASGFTTKDQAESARKEVLTKMK
jgi:hypothetical protein